jgi:uncharacterized membrane protein
MGAKDIMLAIHILCGFVALVTMVMAYVTNKGPKFHARVGRVYGLAMVGVGLTAIILFFLGASTFLLLIAFFSLYLVLVGWRFASNRKGEVSQVDKMLTQFGGLGGIALLGMAVFIATSGSAPFGQSKSFAAVPAAFGVISLALAYQQRTLQVEGSNPRGKKRISLHVTYMGAGTISTVTAFTITVFGSTVLTWLGATMIGTPLLIWNQLGVNKGTIAKSTTEENAN